MIWRRLKESDLAAGFEGCGNGLGSVDEEHCGGEDRANGGYKRHAL